MTRPDGKQYSFEVDAFRKHCLLNGWDDIGLTLRYADKIRAFEERRRSEHPYYFASVPSPATTGPTETRKLIR